MSLQTILAGDMTVKDRESDSYLVKFRCGNRKQVPRQNHENRLLNLLIMRSENAGKVCQEIPVTDYTPANPYFRDISVVRIVCR